MYQLFKIDSLSNPSSLEKEFNKYGVHYISYQNIGINDRDEVLIVVKEPRSLKNKVTSFYPYCTISQLNELLQPYRTEKNYEK